MRKITTILLMLACLSAMAQDRVLRIPYSDNKSIYGVISEPNDSTTKHGIAIISHGFNGTHQFGRDYFKTLNELGYAVYSFDFPCGSIYSQTDNNTMNMSVLDEKEALKTIVKYFQKQKDIDKKNIIFKFRKLTIYNVST